MTDHPTVRTGAALAGLPLRRGWAVRPTSDDDADGLFGLIGAVFDEYDGCVLDPEGLEADLFAWERHLADAGGTGWVVTDDEDEVVACVGVVPVDRTTVELKRLYVGADARRRGLGAALAALVEAWALDHGRGRVELWSDTRFVDAHRLYERLGYARTGDERELHDPSETTESRFRRDLTPGGDGPGPR